MEIRQELQRQQKAGISGNIGWIILGIFAIMLVLALIGMISYTIATQPSRSSLAWNPGDQPSGNSTHDRLLGLSPEARAYALGAIVASSGDGCTGTESFFMGLHPKDNEAYWSVRCSNGKSYEVAIQADAVGSTRVVDCALMRAIAKISCFKRLDEQ